MKMADSMIDRQKTYIGTLVSLRFFAVMLIVIHHLRYLFIPDLLHNENFGILGVAFFLILSGFVISLNYPGFTQIREPLNFLWNRIVRIYPLHIIGFLVCLTIFLFRGFPVSIPVAILNITLLQSYFPSKDIYFSFNSLSWMLSTLFCFYLVFAIANYKIKYFVWLYLISLMVLLLSILYIETSQHGDNPWFRLWLLYIFPPNKLAIILLGVGTAKFLLKGLTQLKQLSGKIPGTVLEITALLLAADFVLWGNFTHLTKSVLIFLRLPCIKSLELINTNYIAAPLITLFVIAVFAIEKGMISQLLKTRPFLLLGEISFSIFISHQILINYLFGYYKQDLLYTLGQFLTVLFLFAVILIISSLIYFLIENPLRNRFRIST
jgi:peptidoglycan/LPS O-acetylase OafA/YrhL